MARHVLGISAHYHDAAAALVSDGVVIAAAQEERFSRRKHDPRFPTGAINYCLGEAFIEPDDLDAVVYYDRPIETLDRVIKNAVTMAPMGRDQFVAGMRAMLGAKARLVDDVEACLGHVPRIMTTQHHAAHAASAFLPSPFETAATLTVDGVGEWATCTIGVGNDAHIELIEEVRYPHSLGLLYSAFTSFCGFDVNGGKYKLMGLAPYGKPRYVQQILDQLVDLRPDGSFRLDTESFAFLDQPAMTGVRFEEIFGGPARERDSPLTHREMDLAASVQAVIEQAVVRLAQHAVALTGSRNLVMAGGVALNCVANGRIQRECDLEGFFIQPAAGDAGGALGAALQVSYETFGVTRRVDAPNDSQRGSLLGPEYSPDEISAFLDRHALPNVHVPDPIERADLVAQALDDGAVVAHFSGRMEFGPRALGSRSILGDPRRTDLQRHMNLAIKFRESFRPFAPAVLAEHAHEHFDLDVASPYMLLVTHVAEDLRLPTSNRAGDEDDITQVINEPRSHLPAVTHVDFSARVQTVGDEANVDFRRVLRAFHARTGCPVLVNTSFNVRDEPIVCSPQDAYWCFMATSIDVLVLGDHVLRREDQPTTTAVEFERRIEPVGCAAPAPPTSAIVAGALFDDTVVPLGEGYDEPQWFALHRDETLASYFTAVDAESARPQDFEIQTADGVVELVKALCSYWHGSGDERLLALAPGMGDVARVLATETQTDAGAVDVLCYTLF